MFGGVAAGLAKASGMDVTVVRILIGMSMIGGLGVLAYILLWVVVPEEAPARGRFVEEAPEHTARIIRVSLVVAGLIGVIKQIGWFWPFDRVGPNHHFGFDGILGVILITVAVSVLWTRHRPDHLEWTGPTPPPPTSDQETAPSPSPAPADGDDDDERPTFVGPFREIVGTVHTEVSKAVKEGKAERERGRAALGWARVVGWLILLWWVAAWIGYTALWRFEATSIHAPGLVYVLAWAAFASVLNTLIRIPRASAVMASLLLLAIPMIIGGAMTETNGPVGSRVLRPTYQDLQPKYEHAIGAFTLDLGDTAFVANKTTDVVVKQGIGHMDITVPNDVSLVIDTTIDAGGYNVLNKQTNGGLGQKERLRFPGCTGAANVHLRLDGGAGFIEVQRANGATEPTCQTAQA